jgi:hypothetical protein
LKICLNFTDQCGRDEMKVSMSVVLPVCRGLNKKKL